MEGQWKKKYCSEYYSMSQCSLSNDQSFLYPKIAEEMFEPHLANLQEENIQAAWQRSADDTYLNAHTFTWAETY